MRLTKEQRDAAIREVLAGAKQLEVARRFGITSSAMHGLLARRNLIPPSTKEKIVKYRTQYPGAKRSEIARAVGTSLGYVNEVLVGTDGELLRLGREALIAGLTVADLRALARQRGAVQ